MIYMVYTRIQINRLYICIKLDNVNLSFIYNKPYYPIMIILST